MSRSRISSLDLVLPSILGTTSRHIPISTQDEYQWNIASDRVWTRFRPIIDFTCASSSHDNDDETTPLTGYDNVPQGPDQKKVSSPLKKKLSNDEPLLELDSSPSKPKKVASQRNNYVNVEPKLIASSKRTQLPDDDAPILMPKQHLPMKKSSLTKQRAEQLVQSEHYQLPPKEADDQTKSKQDDNDDDYQPPLPPKQRHQHNTSRALVYDFIGSELQELRATLAQFDGNASGRSESLQVDDTCLCVQQGV